MYSIGESSWEMKCVKVIAPKSEEKDIMKAVFTDKIACLARNSIPEEMMDQFQKQRKKGFKHTNPYFIEWEYVKEGE